MRGTERQKERERKTREQESWRVRTLRDIGGQTHLVSTWVRPQLSPLPAAVSPFQFFLLPELSEQSPTLSTPQLTQHKAEGRRKLTSNSGFSRSQPVPLACSIDS